MSSTGKTGLSVTHKVYIKMPTPSSKKEGPRDKYLEIFHSFEQRLSAFFLNKICFINSLVLRKKRTCLLKYTVILSSFLPISRCFNKYSDQWQRTSDDIINLVYFVREDMSLIVYNLTSERRARNTNVFYIFPG